MPSQSTQQSVFKRAEVSNRLTSVVHAGLTFALVVALAADGLAAAMLASAVREMSLYMVKTLQSLQ